MQSFTKKGSSFQVSDTIEQSQEKELPVLIKKTAYGYEEANSEEDMKKLRIVSEEKLDSFKIEVEPEYKLKMVLKVDDNTLLIGKIVNNNDDTESAFCLYFIDTKSTSECAVQKGDSFKPSEYNLKNSLRTYPKCSKIN